MQIIICTACKLKLLFFLFVIETTEFPLLDKGDFSVRKCNDWKIIEAC